jgi:hypothetical protein
MRRGLELGEKSGIGRWWGGLGWVAEDWMGGMFIGGMVVGLLLISADDNPSVTFGDTSLYSECDGKERVILHFTPQ